MFGLMWLFFFVIKKIWWIMLGVFPSITKPLFECVLFVLNIKFTSLIFYTCFQGKKVSYTVNFTCKYLNSYFDILSVCSTFLILFLFPVEFCHNFCVSKGICSYIWSLPCFCQAKSFKVLTPLKFCKFADNRRCLF